MTLVDKPAGESPRRSGPIKEDRHFVTALARGLEVLHAFKSGEERLGNHELAERCSLPKSTITRLTSTLTKLGYLHHTAESGRYRLGLMALTLGGSSLLYLLIQRGAATSVTSLLYLVPPTTAFMAWLLFNEPITAITVAGTALTALGVSLVVRPPSVEPATG